MKWLVGPARGARLVARRGLAFRAWERATMAPADPILGLTQDFLKDDSPVKVGLGVGAYRGPDGKPYVLPSVREAEKRVLAKNLDHEYLPIGGDAEFVNASLKFAYGVDSAALKEGRVVGVQVLSGTGACRIVGQVVERFGPTKVIYLPEPTWGNHVNIFRDAGLEVRRYRYLDAKTKTTLDFEGMKADLLAAEAGSVVLLHACAHNPTGVDPTVAQWRDLSASLRGADKLQLFFDCAYQGFASGDAEEDAAALRLFVADGHNVMLAQSYAKNFGLYGDRIGALSMVCANPEDKAVLESQLKALIRPMYSSPPAQGARLVKTILTDPALRAQWVQECRAMADRIKAMRLKLRHHLEAGAGGGNKRDWAHITDQIGMFAYTGLTADQVKKIRADDHVYCTLDGRISVAGLNDNNVEHVAKAINKAVTAA